MTHFRSDRWIASAVAILLHLLIVGLLLWIQMNASEQLPTPAKELWISVGIDPDFGDTSMPQGDWITPASTSASATNSSPTATSNPTPSQQPKETTATPTPRPTATPASTHPKTEPAPKETAQPTGPTEQEVADKVAGLFDRKRPANNQTATGQSEQGSGVSDKGSSSTSAGWSLDGRSIVGSGGRPVLPTRVPDIRGTVVVEITVDAAGQVIQAQVRLRGTNVVDNALRKAAVEAAKKTRFNALGGVPDQKGTITYHFDVKG